LHSAKHFISTISGGLLSGSVKDIENEIGEMNMKILMRILAVLLLIGGLVIAGLMMTGNLVQRAERDFNDTANKLEIAEKKYEIDRSETQKKEVEGWRKNMESSANLLSDRKRNRNFGVIGGVVTAILGIGLFGLSFIFGRKRQENQL
jgi:hypothetical protein